MNLQDFYKKNLRIYQLLISYISTKVDHDSSYWLTPLSSRERYGSDMQLIFKTIAEIEFFLSSENNLKFRSNFLNYLHYKTVKMYLKSLGIQFKISTFHVIKLRFLSLRVSFLLLKDLYVLVREIFLYYKTKNDYDQFNPNDFSGGYLFICPLDLPLMYDENKEYKDRYFGKIPLRLKKKGKKVALTGNPPGGIANFRSRAFLPKDLELFPLISIAMRSSLILVIKIFFEEFFFAPKVTLKSKRFFSPFEKLINFEIFFSLKYRIIGRLVNSAISLVLKKNSHITLIYTYENNFWEKGILQSFRKYSNSGRTVGYLHCAILQSHQKNYADPTELRTRPFPDYIFTTGENAKEALKSIGNYSIGRIKVGVDLRGSPLRLMEVRKRRSTKIKRVLVLLEGLASMTELLHLIIKAKDLEPSINYFVRPHPALDWSSNVMKKIEHDLKNKIVQLDPGKNLFEQICNADLAIYKGSTSVLYAGYYGLPLMRYEDDWWLSDDPLFKINGLKNKFRNEVDLVSGIKLIEGMDDGRFQTLLQIQRDYIFNYLKSSF